LAIAFGEDSYLQGENGRDMIWNPTDVVINDNGNYPAIGGKHFIYIFGTGKHGIARNVQGYRYLGDGDADFARFRTGLEATTANGNPPTAEKTKLLSQVNWVIPTYLAAGYKMKDNVPVTDVTITVRVKKAYAKYGSAELDGAGKPLYDMPRYEFDGASIAPKLTETAGKKSLDMVNVVPNPYRGYSEYENSPVDSRVKITNLPPECTITIFDMAGNLIRKVKKDDESTYYQWDLKNGNNVPISSGLYLIHVKHKTLGEKVVRWYGIMHAVYFDTY